jgi:hypothetical protein
MAGITPIALRGLSALASRPPAKSKRLLLALIIWILKFTAALAATGEVSLTCNPNSEPDLEGYGIYFSKDVDGPPYDLYGYTQIQELADPTQPVFTVSGLEQNQRYFITLTAYNTRGQESAYALSVCLEVSESINECPEFRTTIEDRPARQSPPVLEPRVGSSNSSRGSSGSDGSSAGCFIGTMARDSRLMGIVQLVSLVSLAALIRWAWRWR